MGYGFGKNFERDDHISVYKILILLPLIVIPTTISLLINFLAGSLIVIDNLFLINLRETNSILFYIMVSTFLVINVFLIICFPKIRKWAKSKMEKLENTNDETRDYLKDHKSDKLYYIYKFYYMIFFLINVTLIFIFGSL